MIEIKPVLMGLPQLEGKYIRVRVEFYTNSDSSLAFYDVLDQAMGRLASGSLVIPTLIHQQWGTDDSVVDDYVIESLGLEREIN